MKMKIMTEDERFMLEALKQAKKAASIGETPIGCVIVRTRDYEGNALEPAIIARGYNRRNTEKNPLAHAEISAIRKAAKKLGDWRLEGCTIYVSLEPCPMCAGALVQARIDRVVIGAMNPKAGCVGSILNLLQEPRFNHQAEVAEGILKEQCGRLMSDFFAELRKKKNRQRGETEDEIQREQENP